MFSVFAYGKWLEGNVQATVNQQIFYFYENKLELANAMKIADA